MTKKRIQDLNWFDAAILIAFAVAGLVVGIFDLVFKITKKLFALVTYRIIRWFFSWRDIALLALITVAAPFKFLLKSLFHR